MLAVNNILKHFNLINVLKNIKSMHKKKHIFLSETKKRIGRKTIFLLGTPSHNNIGDCAIAYAEIEFLVHLNLDVVEITTEEYKKFKKCVVHLTRNKIIALHGGGNMGDQWESEEELRRDIIVSCNAKKIILFPQTIFYKNNEKAKESKKYYERNNIFLFAREEESFSLMKKLYNNRNIFLVPDIVMWLQQNSLVFLGNTKVNKKALLLFRNDFEKNDDDGMRSSVMDYLNTMGIEFVVSDMISNSTITKQNRYYIINSKLKEISQYFFVVTDRLHGMVFSYLAQRPCVVLPNYNHKVKGVYNWLKESASINFASDKDGLINCLNYTINSDIVQTEWTCIDTISKFSSLEQAIRECYEN